MLYAQIVNGAPFHIFLSADVMRPDMLHKNEFGQVPISYAKGSLVLWPANLNRTIEQNLKETAGRIATANPQTAPFGSAALAYLKTLPEYSELTSKLVYSNNIAQAFQFVDTGNASIGLLAKSMLVQAKTKFPNKQAQYEAYITLNRQEYPDII